MKKIASFIIVLLLSGCTIPVAPVFIPPAEPSIIGVWKHITATKNTELDLRIDGSYTVHYTSAFIEGEWRYVLDLENTITVRDGDCGWGNIGEYTYQFKDRNTLHINGQDSRCWGRQFRWNGDWARQPEGTILK